MIILLHNSLKPKGRDATVENLINLHSFLPLHMYQLQKIGFFFKSLREYDLVSIFHQSIYEHRNYTKIYLQRKIKINPPII